MKKQSLNTLLSLTAVAVLGTFASQAYAMDKVVDGKPTPVILNSQILAPQIYTNLAKINKNVADIKKNAEGIAKNSSEIDATKKKIGRC